MFRCCSLKTSPPCLLPQSPKVCSIHLCLFFCFACFFFLKNGLLCSANVSFPFSFMWSHLFIFAFVSLVWNWDPQNITKTNVSEVTTSVVLQKFYGFRYYIQVYNPFSINFCVYCIFDPACSDLFFLTTNTNCMLSSKACFFHEACLKTINPSYIYFTLGK